MSSVFEEKRDYNGLSSFVEKQKMTSPADARYAFGEEDAADAAAAQERASEHANTRKAYDKMTPEEVFQEFDTDSSGAIDWAVRGKSHQHRILVFSHRVGTQ